MKSLKILGAVILLLLLFRGPIFRTLITYNDIGTRSTIEITNDDLLDLIETEVDGRIVDLTHIVEIANAITTSRLKFTFGKASNDPNELVNSNKSNCVGYAAMFNSIANHLIEQQGLTGEIEAQHKVGKLDLLGIDLHQFSSSRFFKDHDYNVVTNRQTGNTHAFDTSVGDYLWVESDVFE